MNIRAEFVNPPIPIRNFDWMAWIDGMEDYLLFGHGRTKASALVDLRGAVLVEFDEDEGLLDEFEKAYKAIRKDEYL